MPTKNQKIAVRKPRTDAQRNRERILEVAKEAFTRSGANASLDDIAKGAGVGAGTLYRHFPTRDALIEAVYRTEVEKVAARHGLVVTIVSNGGLRPSANPLLRHVTVADGADAADNWIVDHIAAGDICITADIPLAARCLDKGARVLAPNGKPFTQDGIGMALGMRELSRHLRELTPGGQTHHSGFSKQDRSRFLGELENCIMAVKRRGATG